MRWRGRPEAFARAAGLSTPTLDGLAAMAIRHARDKGLYLSRLCRAVRWQNGHQALHQRYK